MKIWVKSINNIEIFESIWTDSGGIPTRFFWLLQYFELKDLSWRAYSNFDCIAIYSYKKCGF